MIYGWEPEKISNELLNNFIHLRTSFQNQSITNKKE